MHAGRLHGLAGSIIIEDTKTFVLLIRQGKGGAGGEIVNISGGTKNV